METKVGVLIEVTGDNSHYLDTGDGNFLCIKFIGDQEVPLNTRIALSVVETPDCWVVPDIPKCYERLTNVA